MPPHDLYDRTRLFALAIIRFCRALPQTREAQEAAGQLGRAAPIAPAADGCKRLLASPLNAALRVRRSQMLEALTKEPGLARQACSEQ